MPEKKREQGKVKEKKITIYFEGETSIEYKGNVDLIDFTNPNLVLLDKTNNRKLQINSSKIIFILEEDDE